MYVQPYERVETLSFCAAFDCRITRKKDQDTDGVCGDRR